MVAFSPVLRAQTPQLPRTAATPALASATASKPANPRDLSGFWGNFSGRLPRLAEFDSLLACFPPAPGIRSIIRVELERIADCCGHGVPLYRFEGQRTQLPAWAERKGPGGLAQYQQ